MANIGEQYMLLLSELREKVAAHEMAIKALVVKEHELCAEVDVFGSTVEAARVWTDSTVGRVAEKMFDQLIRRAESVFAPVGGEFIVDREGLRGAFGIKDRGDFNWCMLDLAAVWDYLEATYGGGGGEVAAWQQVAAPIVEGFRLGRAESAQFVKGRLVIEMRVSIDDFDKKFKDIHLSYHSREKFVSTMKGMLGFAAWTGNEFLRVEVERLVSLFGNIRTQLVSRAVYGGAGLQLVTFQNRFEFRFDRELAEQFQIFISTYGGLADRAAA